MKRCVVSPVLGLLLMGAGPGVAAAASAQVVSPPGLQVAQSDVGAGGGRVAVVMNGFRRASSGWQPELLTRIGTARRLGAFQRLDAGAFGPQIGVGADGTTVAAWHNVTERGAPTGLRVAIARGDGRFGPAATLATGGEVRLGGIAVTPSGRAVVVWLDGTQVQSSVAPPGGSFGGAVTLGRALYDPPVIAANRAGTVLVGWQDRPDPPLPPPAVWVPRNSRMLAATLLQDAAQFAPVVELDSTVNPSSRVSAFAGPGGLGMSWGSWGPEQAQRVSQLASELTFSPPVQLPMPSSIDRAGPVLTIVRGGTEVALWRSIRHEGPESDVVRSSVVKATFRAPGGAYAPWQPVSARGWLAEAVQLASLRGVPLAAWAETRTGRVSRVRLMARRAGERWVLRGVAAAPQVIPYSVNLAASSRDGIVTWTRQPVGWMYGGRMMLTTYRP